MTTVTCTATDAHLNAAQHTFTGTVVSARAGKLAVLAQLQALAPINTVTDKKIADAISHLQKSVDATVWADDMHPKSGKSDTVFNDEKATVKALAGISSPSPDLAAKTEAWDAALLTADRSIAVTAIAEGGTAKNRAKANDELAKGDADRSSGKFDSAIDHYKKAWKALED